MATSSIVLDLSFDLYGKRLATASADGAIRFFEQDASSSSSSAWLPRGDGFNVGSGAAWRVAWAHPEFGQLVAVCGAATTTSVYEEQEAPDAAGAIVSRWTRKAELGDARAQVNDIEFAPRHLGLRLATGSQDALVRVYEVADVMNLQHWPLTDEFRGAELSAAEAAEVAEAASAATPASGGQGGWGTASAVTCLSWCTSQFDAPLMVVGGGRGEVSVWGVSAAARKWVRMLALRRHEGGRVNDVAWGPNVGRSFHFIASAGSGVLCLWKLLPENATDGGEYAAEAEAEQQLLLMQQLQQYQLRHRRRRPQAAAGARAGGADADDALARVLRFECATAEARHVATFDDRCEVWRCDWNCTGTVLASSGEDGRLRLRRADLTGAWQVVGEQDVPEFSAR